MRWEFSHDRKTLTITNGEEKMVFDLWQDSIAMPHDSESDRYSDLDFYVHDASTDDFMSEAVEDLNSRYSEIDKELELYHHWPNFDDSRAGAHYIVGEYLSHFLDYFVLETEHGIDW